MRLTALTKLPVVAAVIVALAAPAVAEDAPVQKLTLSGSGKSTAEPDLATLSAGVITQAKTARNALTANTERMTAVIAAFKDAGIPDKDVKTTNFSVQPQYHYDRTNNGHKPPKIVGYAVHNTVVVTVRDLTKLGRVLDQSVDVGANTISGPHFDISDRRAATDEARRNAAADALRKAQLYADALGVTLGPILSVTEGAISVPRPPVQMRAAMAADAEAVVPIESGDINLSAQVNITWQLVE